MVGDPITTIQLRSSTRALLESCKRGGETYDELLRELARLRSVPEEEISAEELRELERRERAGPFITLDEHLRRDRHAPARRR